MAPGRFGLSLNLRHSGDILGNLRELLNNPEANVVSFLLRSSLEKDATYQSALKASFLYTKSNQLHNDTCSDW